MKERVIPYSTAPELALERIFRLYRAQFQIRFKMAHVLLFATNPDQLQYSRPHLPHVLP